MFFIRLSFTRHSRLAKLNSLDEIVGPTTALATSDFNCFSQQTINIVVAAANDRLWPTNLIDTTPLVSLFLRIEK